MGLVADDSRLAQVLSNYLHRLAIELAETVNTVTRANAKSIEELIELLHPGGTQEGRDGLGFSCSIAARITGTTSRQNRSATVSNRAAISRVHLTANGSGLNSLLPNPTARPSTADSSEPTVTAASRQASWRSDRISSTMIPPARLAGSPPPGWSLFDRAI